jgi:diguanylate cyclase (GGDEF)-like protein
MAKFTFEKKPKARINENCILASNGFQPYERCSTCNLKVPKCTGMQYNLFILTVSMLLLLFIFLENSLLIRLNIATIIVILVVMGYKVMINSDEIARTSFENIELTGKLKAQSESLQEEVLRQTKELKSLAIHDRLTGLYNRYEFDLRLKNSLEDAHKNGLQHVLCYMDLDQFKIVNDTSGHIAGDELLRQLSILLEEALDGDAFIARLGGDEFGIIIYESTIDEAKKKMKEVLSIVKAYRFSWGDKLFKVGASIGMVPITPQCQDVNELLVFADAACYTAKENGRNRIHSYVHLDGDIVKHRNDLEWLEEIDVALEEGRFELFGQFIKPLKGDELVPHYELLVRIRDTAGNIVDPMAFIPTAERFNKMPIIDRWVIKEAMFLLRELLNQGESCQFSINLSGQSLGDEELSEYIKALFLQTEIPYESICFEVTETAAISNLSKALVFIKELRSLGCCFSLDDFGSGLSSFAYLKNIPVDYLKIDGQFIQDIHTNEINAQMVKAIHEIAGTMKIKTICEYVENEEIHDYLCDIGIDYAQGDYLCVTSSIKECLAKYQSQKKI